MIMFIALQTCFVTTTAPNTITTATTTTTSTNNSDNNDKDNNDNNYNKKQYWGNKTPIFKRKMLLSMMHNQSFCC